MAERERTVALRLLREGIPAEKIAKAIPSVSIEELKQLKQEALETV